MEKHLEKLEEILEKQEKDSKNFNKDFEGRFNVIEKAFGKDKEKLIAEIAKLKKENTQKYFGNLNDAIKKLEKLVPKENKPIGNYTKNISKIIKGDDDDETLTLISKPVKKGDINSKTIFTKKIK